MTILTLVAALLALIWGLIWALMLQVTHWGQFIARRRTWVAVAIGVGVDLLILTIVLDLPAWLNVLIVIAASALPIIGRSLFNEYADTVETLATITERRD